MLLRLAERHGVRVRSLQHVLEGYKVAAEIAAHGASASTFSDWWAYKVEAYDAIPFNAALLTRAGASVCIKSDSPELVRHLNLEAAKTVKYGGATVDQALAMITINPAHELGLEGRIGSLEPGKDADIVLFNGHPFDATSRCEVAIIDGEVWFQRRAAPDGASTPRQRTPRPHNRDDHGQARLARRAGPSEKSLRAHRRDDPSRFEAGDSSWDRGHRGRNHRGRRRRGDADPRRRDVDRRLGAGRLARHDRRRLPARPGRDRQPSRNSRQRRFRSFPARVARGGGPPPRQRLDSRDARATASSPPTSNRPAARSPARAASPNWTAGSLPN